MNQEDIEALHQRIPVHERLPPFSNIERGKKGSRCVQKVKSFLPFLDWLPKYKWTEDLKYDIIAGLTVGIMVVPQGMAYASLAGIPPVYGLYASFFAPIIYTFFGTSRHISVGIFAVGSMMVGNVKLRFAPDDIVKTWYENGTLKKEVSRVMGEVDFGFEFNATELLSSLTLTVGIVQIIMALFRLGFITTYMTDQLLSGFTTGSACHVLMSQLNKILGVPMPRHSGVGMLIRMLGDILWEIPQTNLTTFIISVSSLTFLIISHTFIGPFLKRKFSFPIPFELTLVIISTTLSQFFDISTNNDVKIVKYVPRGIPEPSLPNLVFVPYLIADAISIAIICYMFVVSMGMLFARKHGYRTDPTQEMYALGFMNLFGSLFPVYPSGASLSRSSVCEMNGVRTQLVNLFICAVLLVVILWLGPFLEPLPLCVLASIVISSLISLFKQSKELPRLWRVSKWDFAIWVVSFLTTVLTDPTKGLIVSFAFTVFTVVLREQWPKINTKQFNDKSTYVLASNCYKTGLTHPDLENVQIVTFQAPLHFANVEKFKEMFTNLLSVNVILRFNGLKKASKANNDSDDEQAPLTSRIVIVDCSCISYIDFMGMDAIKEQFIEAQKKGVQVYLTNIQESVLDMFEKYDIYEDVPKTRIYPNLQEAVTAVRQSINV